MHDDVRDAGETGTHTVTARAKGKLPIYEFGPFRMDPSRRLLERDGVAVAVAPKAFDTLLLLIAERGRVVDKLEVLRSIWPDTVVEENNLNQSISSLRRVLGDSRGESRFIATIPGRGYCFTAEARTTPGTEQDGGPQRALRLAVLPFANLGAGPEREYLVDGLTEETIAALGQIDPDQLSVLGRTSVMTYRHTVKPLAEIGRELQATHVIEGSLRAEGERLRITAKLIRVSDQLQIWSSSYDAAPRSMLAFQCELSQAIADQVRLRLTPSRIQALSNRQTRNLEAYDLYLRGRFYWNQFSQPATQRAIEFFRRAVAIDPDYALAWSGLADVYSQSPVTGDAPHALVAKPGREAAENAIRSDPTLAEAQASYGFHQFWLGWDWHAAEAAFRRAIEADPNYAFAHRMLGIVLSHCRVHDEEREAIRRACELDPLHPMNRALAAQIAFAARDPESALQHARAALALDPEFWIGYMQLAQACVGLGRDQEALDALTQTGRWSSGNSKALSLRGYILARGGRREEALAILDTLQSISRERYVPAYATALVHLGFDDRDQAIAALERGLNEQDVHLAFLTIDAKWDPLREDAQFRALLERCAFWPAVRAF